MPTINVAVGNFCENCGKTRRVSLIPVGRWFIWFCLPCQFRYALSRACHSLRRKFISA